MQLELRSGYDVKEQIVWKVVSCPMNFGQPFARIRKKLLAYLDDFFYRDAAVLDRICKQVVGDGLARTTKHNNSRLDRLDLSLTVDGKSKNSEDLPSTIGARNSKSVGRASGGHVCSSGPTESSACIRRCWWLRQCPVVCHEIWMEH